MSESSSGKGFLGWLGRQIGHVKRAVQTDVAADQPKVLYRNERVSEATPDNAGGLKLRRTVIDEVIADGAKEMPSGRDGSPAGDSDGTGSLK